MNVNAQLSPLLGAGNGFPGLLIVLGGTSAAILVFGLIWLRHRLTCRRVTTRFEEFKEHVIHFRQRVEAVKERHKLLPASDKDFQEAMTGATLTLYNQIQKDVGGLWDDWLARMDIWEQIQALIQAGRFPGVGRLKEANRLLDKLGSFDQVDRACQTCVQGLDQLEQGHEQAKKMIGQADEKPGQLRQQLEAVARLPLPTTPYEAELTACAALTEQARKLLRADPIGAEGILKTCLDRLGELDECLKAVVRLFQQAQEARSKLDQVARLTTERRAGGLLLTEPEGNPDPLLEQGRTQHGAMLQALERGAAKEAAGLLEQALALAERANGTIERQATAREQSARDIPVRRAEAQRLQQATAAAEGQQGELERSFAPESYGSVADHLVRARELQSTADGLIEEAAAAAAETIQHYFQACALLDRVRQQQEQAGTSLLEIGQCLQRLSEVRQQCLVRRQDLLDLAGRVQGFFAMHPLGIRQPARSRLAAAEDRSRLVRGQIESPRPNWPVIRQAMDEAAAALKQAEDQARQDLQLADRAAAEIDAADRELARARGFFQLGISATMPMAEGLLGQARLRLSEQAYEQAIDQAGGAQRTARQAYDDAVRRVQQEQQRLDQERMRMEQERMRLDQERQRMEAAAAAQFATPPQPVAEAVPASWASTPDPVMDPPASEAEQPDPPPSDTGQASW
jgi:hypothetical protein